MGLSIALLVCGSALTFLGAGMGGDSSVTYTVLGHTVRVTPWGIRGWDEEYRSDHGTALVIDEPGYTGSSMLEPFTQIDADLSIGDVDIYRSSEYSVWLSWDTGSSYEMTYENVDGVLKLRDSGEYPKDLGIHYGCRATITLPYDMGLETVCIRTHQGDIELSDLEVGELTAETQMGDIHAYNCAVARTWEIYSKMGDLDLWDCAAGGGLAVQSNMGDISVDGNFPCDMTLTADMGDILLYLEGDRDKYQWDFHTGMGELYLDGESLSNGMSGESKGGSGEHLLSLSSEMGDVEVSFCS